MLEKKRRLGPVAFGAVVVSGRVLRIDVTLMIRHDDDDDGVRVVVDIVDSSVRVDVVGTIRGHRDFERTNWHFEQLEQQPTLLQPLHSRKLRRDRAFVLRKMIKQFLVPPRLMVENKPS